MELRTEYDLRQLLCLDGIPEVPGTSFAMMMIFLSVVVSSSTSPEEGLLKVLGITRRPRPPPKGSTPPQDLLNLYNVLTSQSRDTVNMPLPGRHTGSANTVRSFTHAGKDENQRPLRKFRLHFTVEETVRSETLTAAELRLYGLRPGQLVIVHDIVSPGRQGGRGPLLRPLDTQTVDKDGSALVDVTPAVERWGSSRNYGVLVEAAGAAPRVRRSTHQLFLYSDDGRRSPRRPRAAPKKDIPGQDNCRRHPLYVDFAQIGWNDWIVAPPGYDAYYCQGNCVFPMSDHFNITNHATIQSIVQSFNPNAVPKPCCVPTELTAISLLYHDEGKIVLKNYQEMTVVGCGCR